MKNFIKINIVLFFLIILNCVASINVSFAKNIEKQAQKDGIMDKLKNALNSLGNKVNNVVTGVQNIFKKGRIKTVESDDSKNGNKKIIKYYIDVPPPDAEIFKQNPIDITASRPFAVKSDNGYMINDVWIYQNSGDSIEESMSLAFYDAVDISFSNLIVELGLNHIKYTISDAANCIRDFYIDNERFFENEYIARFSVTYDSEKLRKTTQMKIESLLVNGFDEYSRMLNKIPVKIIINNKNHWLEIEKLLDKSSLPYIINGFSSNLAIVTIGSNGENIAKTLAQNNLKLYVENKKYYIKLITNEEKQRFEDYYEK
ncbi:hypothetical protein [Candidatus Deianiraea vastatrix]|uniref:Uncharacterized protein n=1 Tax=Candidatus Deianiraea vastatrix TaxID=2163644 RepID=A0A5B8XDB5_9RICK|nr:hypothetical protein [Candidatus Deianiraea vastatrix]QED23240.1 hypothetical protein Deia_00440 [Candidatus Deianiraea vastatrix]